MRTYVVVYGVNEGRDWVAAEAEDVDEIERRFAEPLTGYAIYLNNTQPHNLIKRVLPVKDPVS